MLPLSQQLRTIIDGDGSCTEEVLALADRFAQDSSSDLSELETELQQIYQIQHAPSQLFLNVLHRLSAILSATSIIDWYDILLRPCLRDPSLPTLAVQKARQLILTALEDANQPDIVAGFRRRLLDLYLLDAFNDSSKDDVLEWASMDASEQATRKCYKDNLEAILLQFGEQNPNDLIAEVHDQFRNRPSSRLRLVEFLNIYAPSHTFHEPVLILASSGFLTSMLTSMLLDNSSSLCTVELTLLAKILPILAVHAPDTLKHMLPSLLAVLARTLCWRDRPPIDKNDAVTLDPEVELELSQPAPVFQIQSNSGLEWHTLHSVFDDAKSTSPSPRSFFTMLYFLFPCNTLRFLRGPIDHLDFFTSLPSPLPSAGPSVGWGILGGAPSNNLPSPYTVGWREVLDEAQIRSRSEHLLHSHVCHPMIIWRDYQGELSQPDFWSAFDVSRIACEATMLDVHNVAVSLRESEDRPSIDEPTPKVRNMSLQEMIATSVALKATTDSSSTSPSSASTSLTIPRRETARTSLESVLFTKDETHTPREDKPVLLIDDGVPSHVAQAIANLQREILILRNDLQFTEWLGRENVRHVGRLYHDSVLSKNAETERQALYNKFRGYRMEVVNLKRELKEKKEQALKAKDKYADWNQELTHKLQDFRNQKKAWISEEAALRTAEKEVQARFSAQSKLLADANQENFDLKTKLKESQPKIDRLHDYERQLQQHLDMQKLWDEDFKRFNERGEVMELVKSQFMQMKMRLESTEKSMEELGEAGRADRRRIRSLEAQVAMGASSARAETSLANQANLGFFVKEKQALTLANSRVSKENLELKDELEGTRAMVEILKSQVSGQKGLV